MLLTTLKNILTIDDHQFRLQDRNYGKGMLPEEEGEKELCHILTNGSWEDISKLFK